DELALGVEPAAAVLQHVGVTRAREPGRDLRLRAGDRVFQAAIRVVRAAPVVRGAHEERRPRPRTLRQIDVRGEAHAVAHRNELGEAADLPARAHGPPVRYSMGAPGPTGRPSETQITTRSMPAVPKATLNGSIIAISDPTPKPRTQRGQNTSTSPKFVAIGVTLLTIETPTREGAVVFSGETASSIDMRTSTGRSVVEIRW